MAVQMVIITIGEGECTVETEGFQGKGCAAIHEGFAKAVGTSTHMEKKREFNAPIIAANRLTQGK